MRNVIVHYAYQQLISTCCLSAGRCRAAPAEMLLRTKPLYSSELASVMEFGFYLSNAEYNLSAESKQNVELKRLFV